MDNSGNHFNLRPHPCVWDKECIEMNRSNQFRFLIGDNKTKWMVEIEGDLHSGIWSRLP